MDRKELINIINELLVPIGFKKKGNYWLVNSDAITKIINIQKSQFGESYYINYGYVLKELPLDGLTMHVFNRFSSSDIKQKGEIDALLNLESDIADGARKGMLRTAIEENLIKKIRAVNDRDDLLAELKKRSHLNDIPLVVKQYFNLPVD